MKNNTNFYADSFRNTLDEMKLHYREQSVGPEITGFAIGMSCESISHLLYTYVVRATGQCSIQTILANEVAGDKRARVLEQLNKFHQKQRYIKFMLDRDNDIVAKLDFMFPPFVDEEAGELAIAHHMFGMLIMMHETLDKYIPELMSVLWFDNEGADKPKVKTDTSFLEELVKGLKKAREEAAEARGEEKDKEEEEDDESAD